MDEVWKNAEFHVQTVYTHYGYIIISNIVDFFFLWRFTALKCVDTCACDNCIHIDA